MRRKARIDAPGALHHIIVRGIERKKIFKDDSDHFKFLERLGVILSNTKTDCLAWAIIPNHFHLVRQNEKRIKWPAEDQTNGISPDHCPAKPTDRGLCG